MITKPSLTVASWHRVGRWAAATCLLALVVGWASSALAASCLTWWDCTYQFRKKITITAGTVAVPTNYSVRIQFDHAALTPAKSLANGDDIRIVYWNGSAWIELDRRLDDQSAWATTTTQVWFRTQAAISASQSDGNYYLYYGKSSATTPPTNWANIFLFYDDFNDGSFDTARWSCTLGTCTESGGNLTLNANSRAWATLTYALGTDTRWEARLKLGGDGTESEVDYLAASNTVSWTPMDKWILFWTDGSAHHTETGNAGDNGGNFPTYTAADPTNFHVYAFTREGTSNVRFFREGLEIRNDISNIPNADLRFFLWVDKVATTMSHDWVRVRKYVTSEPSTPSTALGGEEAVSCGGAPPPFAPCNWGYRRKLTFNNAAQAENLMNFPVLVVLNSSRINYAQTQNAGQDLRFTDSDGTILLAHEIEKWDEAGTSYVWVKVPQIDSSSTTDYIWMYYGNASAPDGQDPCAVWDGNFAMVQHLKETSGQHQDSTSNAHTSSAISVTTQGSAAGRANGADNFGANNQRITFPDSADWDLTGTFTLEAWVNGADNDTVYQGVVTRNNAANTDWDFGLVANRGASTRPACYYGPLVGIISDGPDVNPNAWTYIVCVWDGTSQSIYIDGVFHGRSIGNPPGIDNTSNPLFIGAPSTDEGYVGVIDEVRISNTARSAAWIAATHKSMTDVFITYGAQETQGFAVSYFSPDAAAAGLHVPVTFVGSFCGAAPTVTTSSSDIIVLPSTQSIMTDATGAVVASNGKALSTMFFVKPGAGPRTGITVSLGGTALTQTFDIVIPAPDPNITSGTGTLSGQTKGGTKVLGGLTVGAGGTLSISTTDTDPATAGNQGYLPAVILVKGDVNIAGTLDLKGRDGTNAGANATGGDGGTGGPGGGGGGGGGVKEGGGGGTSGTLDIRVTASADDAEERLATGAVDLTNNTDLDLESGTEVGLRFQNLTIPQGSTITSAYIVFTAQDPDSGSTNMTFFAQDIDNAPTFTTATNNVTSRTKTSASVSWNNVPAWTAGLTYQTPDLSPVIQEIVGRAGWASGNSLVILVTASGERDALPYDADATKAPLLHVGYTAPGAGGSSIGAPGGTGRSGGGGGGSKGTGTGGAGGTGTGAAGAAPSRPAGGDGGTAFGGATGGGGGLANTQAAGGDGGGGGTGDPFGTGGTGASTDGASGGKGGGGGGASDATPGGGAGGGFATAGARGSTDVDAGYGGDVNGNAQLVPLSGGSGGAGGAPDIDITSVHRGGGGGGGGGAIQIYATGSLTLTTGTITAQGGNGGNGYGSGSGGGGGGSGGAIVLQSGKVTTTGTLTAAGGTGGTGAAGGAGGSGRIRIDGLESGSVPGTAGSKFIGPVIDTLVGTTVKGRADGGSTVTLYIYYQLPDGTGAQVTGSPYTGSASGSSGTVGTWEITNVTFPSGTAYLAVKQSSGSIAVFGPGRATKGLHLINWREVY